MYSHASVFPFAVVVGVVMFIFMGLSGQGLDLGFFGSGDNYNVRRINNEFQMFGLFLAGAVIFGFFIVVGPMVEARQRESVSVQNSNSARTPSHSTKVMHKKTVHKVHS